MFRQEKQTDIVRYLLNDILPRRQGYVAMLKVYLDRGAKPDGSRVMCVAGALFRPWFYDAFLEEWQAILDGWDAKAFHATDFYPGAREFSRKRPDGTLDPEKVERFHRDSRRIVEIIAATTEQLFVMTLRTDEYEAIAPQAWRDQFGGVHRIAAQLIAGAIGFWAEREHYAGEIAYFYETGDDDEASVNDAFRKLYDDPVQRRHTRMAATPIGVEKGKAHGLEVADFLAWHWTKWDSESRETRKRPMRFKCYAKHPKAQFSLKQL